MGEVTAVRTPVIIANEINGIKDQTKTIILYNSIEIGRRLHEAKLLVDHGEWGDWLKTYIDYSKSTANNLMRIFDEYGSSQIAFFGDNSKSQALGSLSYTQAVALLGVPDKEEFIKENDVENMSTRELQEAIKAQKVAEKRAEEAEKKASEAESAKEVQSKLKQDAEKRAKDAEESLKNEKKKTKVEVDRLSGLLEIAKSNGDSSEKVKKLESELEVAQDQVQELTDKINAPITVEAAVIEKVPESIELELSELREKNKNLEEQASKQSPEILKFSLYFDSLTSGFKGLLGSLEEIKEVDMEKYEKYKNAVNGLLGKMSEKLV